MLPPFYIGLFVVLAAICAGTQYLSRTETKVITSPAFKRFQWLYLIIYYTVMCADWLQGPYVYVLYISYGFEKNQVAQLFIAGFLSSMIFGTIVGSIADKYGRKRMCICFGVFYSLSCLTKLINNYWVLMLGRILSGIATSLLFSAFESWMVYEHNKNGFNPEWLSLTFSLATFGNGIVAILAGLMATFVAKNFGYVAPFMLSLVLLVIATVMVHSYWEENYGDSRVDISGTFSNAVQALKSNWRIPLLGCIQSFFEAAMYTFVFMWTPALLPSDGSEHDEGLMGLIFACFMVCIMIGSSIFVLLLPTWPVERIARLLLAIAASALSVPYFSADTNFILVGFLVFEMCCGMYFPCMGTLRGSYIPEQQRAAVMNFFRLPMNFLVVVVLLNVGYLSNTTVFLISTLWLATAFVGQHVLVTNPGSRATQAPLLEPESQQTDM